MTWPPPMSAPWAIVELIIVAFLTIFAGAIFLLLLQTLPFADTRWITLLATTGAGLAALLVCAILLVIDGQKPSDIGWRAHPAGANLAVGVIGTGVTIATRIILVTLIMLFFPTILDHLDQAQEGIEETLPPLNLTAMVALMIFVSIWEEVVFRGFLLTRLQAVFKRWWLTILTGSALFGLIHDYQGVLAMVLVTIMGIILGVIFVWRKSLLPCIVLHALHNIIVLLALKAISPTWP